MGDNPKIRNWYCTFDLYALASSLHLTRIIHPGSRITEVHYCVKYSRHKITQRRSWVEGGQPRVELLHASPVLVLCVCTTVSTWVYILKCTVIVRRISAGVEESNCTVQYIWQSIIIQPSSLPFSNMCKQPTVLYVLRSTTYCTCRLH